MGFFHLVTGTMPSRSGSIVLGWTLCSRVHTTSTMGHFSSYCVSLCYWAEYFLPFLILNGRWSLPLATPAHERWLWTDPRPVPAGSQTHPKVGIRRRVSVPEEVKQPRVKTCPPALSAAWTAACCNTLLTGCTRAGLTAASQWIHPPAAVVDLTSKGFYRDESCSLRSNNVSEVSSCFSITSPLNSLG